MKNAILFGNGFNLLSGNLSWDKLLNRISKDSLISDIPNTLQYETIILANEYYQYEPFILADGSKFILADGKEFWVRDKSVEEDIKNQIKDELEAFSSNFAYERLYSLNIEHYITTNYDKVLYNLLCNNGYKKGESNNTESLYSIRRKFGLQNEEGKYKYIWPIHGTIQHPKSIMLGLDHYCGSIGKINDYIKGKYEYNKNGEPHILKGIIQRIENNECEIPFSWIDLFFTHNIHIIGFGLQYEETDLWWILNKRQRYIKQHSRENIISNNIYFYGDVEENKKALLMKLGVEVCSFDSKGLKNTDSSYYKKQYEFYLDKIESYCK